MIRDGRSRTARAAPLATPAATRRRLALRALRQELPDVRVRRRLQLVGRALEHAPCPSRSIRNSVPSRRRHVVHHARDVLVVLLDTNVRATLKASRSWWVTRIELTPSRSRTLHDQVGDGGGGDGVEAGGGLVVEHDLRARGQGARHRHPAPLAAGELGGHACRRTGRGRRSRASRARAPRSPPPRARRPRSAGSRRSRRRSASRRARPPGRPSRSSGARRAAPPRRGRSTSVPSTTMRAGVGLQQARGSGAGSWSCPSPSRPG